MINVDEVRALMLKVDRSLMLVRATGGWKYRTGIPMTDKQVEENAATIPGEFKGLALEVFIGHELARRHGLEKEAEEIAREILGVLRPKGDSTALTVDPPKPTQSTEPLPEWEQNR